MGETSAIEWTDATVNFWWGCTKVGPGCDHCYAEALDKRFGPSHWGTGTPRRQIASAATTLAKLNRQGGKRVFIQSMSDLFDNEVPTDWFAEAWEGIQRATRCRIQIVTKRISMVEKRLTEIGAIKFGWPSHAGLMITVVNQSEADRDIPRLLALKVKLGIPWVGLSMEPLLGPVDLVNLHPSPMMTIDALHGRSLSREGDYSEDEPRLNWVIVGGESGPKARPIHPDWARGLRGQCQAAGVPFFFKQWGEWGDLHDHGAQRTWMLMHADGTLDIPDDRWPDEEAGEIAVVKVGKARAGRFLDGREWNDMPGALT
ncbi:MAG: phage Gp37/Gp68 family protein [Tabrizicola sp.]|nr:phage Gp37/Gp68 family protein [Tabrizicola sp.]